MPAWKSQFMSRVANDLFGDSLFAGQLGFSLRQLLSVPISCILFAVFLLFPGFTLADTAILVALPSQQGALSREVRIVGQPIELAQHKVSIGYHKGEKLYIVRTGAGNLNSAMVTQALLTRYKIDRVISIGVAGNLNDEWKIGDLLITTNVVNHQEGKETSEGFKAAEKPEVRSQNSEEYRRKCGTLQSNAVEIAKELLEQSQAGSSPGGAGAPAPSGQAQNEGKRAVPPTNIREGRLVSGDSFIAGTAKRKWLHETFQADAVDMVSAGIARVCEANGVPYVIIRSLSDNADESASAAFASFVQSGKESATIPVGLALVERFAVKLPASPPVEPH